MSRLAAVLFPLLGTALLAQDGQELLAETESSLFLQGWMLERMEGDIQGAREMYRLALANGDPEDPQTELAARRLLEITWEQHLRASLVQEVRDLGLQIPVAGRRDTTLGRIETLQAKLTTALDAGDAVAMRSHRAELESLVQSDWNGNTGLGAFVQTMVQGSDRASPAERRRQALVDARMSGDTTEVQRLTDRILSTQPPHVIARAWTLITKGHLAGRHQTADQQQELFRRYVYRFGRRRSIRPSSQRRNYTAPQLVTWIGQASEAAKHNTLDQVLERLDGGTLRRRDLLPNERATLVLLSRRLKDHAAREQFTEALTLAARIPYRGYLFPEIDALRNRRR